MNLPLDFRRGIETLPNVMENIVAKINTLWKREHNDDGTHGTVTADQVDVEGPIITEAIRVQGVNTITKLPTPPVNTSGNFLDIAKTTAGVPFIWSRTPPQNPAPSVDGQMGALVFFGTTVDFNRNAGLVQINPHSDGGRIWCRPPLDTQLAGDFWGSINSKDTVRADRGFYEWTRLVKQGDWTNRAFTGSDYNSGGPGAWTVAAGSQALNRYTWVGHTLIWNVGIVNSTLAAGGATDLRINIPVGNTSAALMYAPVAYFTDGAGALHPAMVEAQATWNFVRVFRTDGLFANIAAGALVTFYFQLSIEMTGV